MGRTIPSYRIATEIERKRWRPFRLMLNRKDRKLFDDMLNLPRLYNVAGMMACRPVVFHSVMMSIVFHHYKELLQMVDHVKRLENGITADQKNRCPGCKRGILEPTTNKKVHTCDNCGRVNIEMTTADYGELFKQQKITIQQKIVDYNNGSKSEI